MCRCFDLKTWDNRGLGLVGKQLLGMLTLAFEILELLVQVAELNFGMTA